MRIPKWEIIDIRTWKKSVEVLLSIGSNCTAKLRFKGKIFPNPSIFPLWLRDQVTQDNVEHGSQLGYGCADDCHHHSVTEMKAADREAK